MDYSSYTKPKLVANIFSGIVCYAMFGYCLYESIEYHANLLSAFVFLFLAVNCTYRVYSYFKLDRFKKSAPDEASIVRAERRQSIVFGIFSNATAMLCILAYLIYSIIKHLPSVTTIICAIVTLCFGGIMIMNIRNLKKFDRA